MPAPPGLVLVLHSKATFVRDSITAGKFPTAAQTATFIRTAVAEMLPHIRLAPPIVAQRLKDGFAGIGWDVAANAPAAGGTGPPVAADILAFFDGSFMSLRPTLQAANQAVEIAKQVASEADREKCFLDEEELNGGCLSSKQAKQLAVLQEKLPHLHSLVLQSEAVASAVAAVAPAEELAAAGLASTQRKTQLEAVAQKAAATKQSMMPGTSGVGSGKRNGTRGNSGGGGYRTGGGGQGGGAGDGKTIEFSREEDKIVEAGSLKKGAYILLDGRACRIREQPSASKTGKHGHGA